MRPSTVRKRIRSEHDELRQQLDKLQVFADRLLQEDAGAIASAVTLGRAMYDRLREHIELEDALLVPALREADAWGEVRAAKLVAHHEEQQKELVALANNTSPDVEPKALGNRLRAFILDLHADMEHEETVLLDESLLRDDVVGIDVDVG